jgi:hypothetical protein
MLVTSAIGCWETCLSFEAYASDAEECLKHLGGAFYGVECYSKVIREIESRITSKSTSVESMNKNEVYQRTFRSYLHMNEKIESFCVLPRDASAGWRRPEHETPPTYIDSDVIFLECKYNLLKAEEKFLDMIITSAQ